MTAAVVPLKNLARAKGRLAPVLSAAERRGLVLAMLGDVLAALLGARGLGGIYVVADEAPPAPEGVAWIAEPANRGYDAAVATALADPRVAGAAAMLVLPGDLPLATPADIDALLDEAPRPGARVALARDGDGTNALLLSPPDLAPTRFGPGSGARHRALALAAGAPAETVSPPGLAFDIDTPRDLLDFCARDGGAGTHAFLRESGAMARLARLDRGRRAPPDRGEP